MLKLKNLLKIQYLNWSKVASAAALKQYRADPGSLLACSESDCEQVLHSSKIFWQKQLSSAGADGLVLGLSGGLDSAVVASLAVRSLGSQAVYGVLLPSQFTEQQHITDALQLAKQLGIQVNDYQTVQLKFAGLLANLAELGEKAAAPEVQQLKMANLQARVRMLLLRDIARARNFLVAGTGNASELFTGYFTLAGDGLGGIDNEVLGSLFKTQVRQLAHYLKVPKAIIEKAPTAGLYAGQTDEAELGLSYEQLDLILVGWLLRLKPIDIAKILHFELELIEKVLDRVARNAYKLQVPPILKFHD